MIEQPDAAAMPQAQHAGVDVTWTSVRGTEDQKVEAGQPDEIPDRMKVGQLK
jgi:hypothetical protein